MRVRNSLGKIVNVPKEHEDAVRFHISNGDHDSVSSILGGGTPKADDGMTMLDDNTVQFNGPSHEDGGIPIQYGGKNVEVEGDETGYKSPVDDSLTIMGNMKNPITGRKFKNDSKILAEKEAKMNSLMDDGLKLIDENKPMDKWESLKFNAGKVMAKGAYAKKKELMGSKEHLKALQQAMLDVSQEQGIEPQKLADGKFTPTAQLGITVPMGYAPINDGSQDGYVSPRSRRKPPTSQAPAAPVSTPPVDATNYGWQFNQTNTTGLDDKIKKFTDMLVSKGLTGYSGPESGVSQRNTKQGRASRHATGEALDTFINQPNAYEKVLNDPELSKYLIDNGLTAINEYDPNVAKQTGATAGHLHIGYDRGTPVSDQFRKDAAAKYKNSNPDWGWGATRNPQGKPIAGAKQGDLQYFPYDAGRVAWQDQTTVPQEPRKPAGAVPPSNYNFTNPAPYPMPSNAQDLEFNQILPELYTMASNKREPVFAQKFQPELFQPYQVSFQDKLNENQATFSALQKASAYNPSALATLAGQKYSADSSSLAEEFRTNQGIANDITNRNKQLLNDATLKNLGIADTQYGRQEQAKSNTKAINHMAINSITDKMLENEANNRRIQLYENLYRFRFDPTKNYQAYNAGAPGQEYVDWTGDASTPGIGMSSSQSIKQNYDKNGRLTSSSIMTPSLNKQQLEAWNIENKNPLVPDVKKSLKGTFTRSFNQWLHK